MKNKLINYRKEIDVIDKNISKLIEKRFNIVKNISAFKKKNNIKVKDIKREKEVFKNVKVRNSKINTYIKRIYKLILRFSKESQK